MFNPIPNRLNAAKQLLCCYRSHLIHSTLAYTLLVLFSNATVQFSAINLSTSNATNGHYLSAIYFAICKGVSDRLLSIKECLDLLLSMRRPRLFPSNNVYCLQDQI